jgi:hypothetical protein
MDLPLYGQAKLFDTSKGELLSALAEGDQTSKGSRSPSIPRWKAIVPQKDGTFKVSTNTGVGLR